jgi:hypothetical protein
LRLEEVSVSIRKRLPVNPGIVSPVKFTADELTIFHELQMKKIPPEDFDLKWVGKRPMDDAVLALVRKRLMEEVARVMKDVKVVEA